jgi:hypothetical protein
MHTLHHINTWGPPFLKYKKEIQTFKTQFGHYKPIPQVLPRKKCN